MLQPLELQSSACLGEGCWGRGDLLQNPLWLLEGVRRGVREEITLLKPHLTELGLQRGSKVKPGGGLGLGP